MRRALISGIVGMDGSHLADFLLAKGYEVHGILRRASTFTTGRIEHIRENPRLHLHFGDLSDGTGLRRILELSQPDEVYNLAAMSHVRVSFDQPEYTADVVATGTLRFLEAVRDMKAPIRFYQAGSSESFGASPAPQNESTPFHPRSPYGVAKLAAHWYAKNYREAYDMFVACGILFNHSGPRRGETFVCRKITRGATRIAMGLQDKLHLGNLNAQRDWGFAGDYVEAHWSMLQLPTPGDFVIATGESFTVKQWLDTTFKLLHLNWRDFVVYDAKYERPAEVEHLAGDASKAREAFGWVPRVKFDELIRMMVDHDLGLARREKAMKELGHG